MDPIHDTSIGYSTLLNLLKKLPPRENTQPINILYGENILFEDHTAKYGLDEFVERVKSLKEKMMEKNQNKKRKGKSLRSIILIAEDEEEEKKENEATTKEQKAEVEEEHKEAKAEEGDKGDLLEKTSKNKNTNRNRNKALSTKQTQKKKNVRKKTTLVIEDDPL
jgi:hypothetical protein